MHVMPSNSYPPPLLTPPLVYTDRHHLATPQLCSLSASRDDRDQQRVCRCAATQAKVQEGQAAEGAAEAVAGDDGDDDGPISSLYCGCIEGVGVPCHSMPSMHSTPASVMAMAEPSPMLLDSEFDCVVERPPVSSPPDR